MSLRWFPILLVLMLAGCQGRSTPADKPGLPPPPDVAAPPPDSLKAPSGLSTRDTIVVHYTGWTTDGKMFDSSVQRGQPAEFQVNRVIRGWTEGLQMMVEGEKRRLWIPEALAYQGQPDQPRGMLVFDVELIDIK
jgi:peptidylprolyl isomerase